LKRPAGITLDSVSRHYATHSGSVRAVDGISLEVDGGASLAVTGPSGCGKSTLLGLIGGLEPPTAGSVVIGEQRLSSMPERRRVGVRRQHIGFVFQSDNLLPFLTATENVAHQLCLASGAGGLGLASGAGGLGPASGAGGLGPASGAGGLGCLELLADLGLSEAADKLPDQLSGGQRQRVAIARALIHRPAVILADEPTGSVDGANADGILDLLLAAQRETGATLVVVTHDRAVAERLDRSVELRDGKLVEHEPTATHARTDGH